MRKENRETNALIMSQNAFGLSVCVRVLRDVYYVFKHSRSSSPNEVDGRSGAGSSDHRPTSVVGFGFALNSCRGQPSPVTPEASDLVEEVGDGRQRSRALARWWR